MALKVNPNNDHRKCDLEDYQTNQADMAVHKAPNSSSPICCV